MNKFQEIYTIFFRLTPSYYVFLINFCNTSVCKYLEVFILLCNKSVSIFNIFSHSLDNALLLLNNLIKIDILFRHQHKFHNSPNVACLTVDIYYKVYITKI